MEIAIGIVAAVATVIGTIYSAWAFHRRPKGISDPPAAIVSEPSVEPISLPPVQQKYEEWLRKQTEDITVHGLKIGRGTGVAAIKLPILSLYADLHVRPGLVEWDAHRREVSLEPRLPIGRLLELSERCIILGGPGEGKTTFLRYWARKRLELGSHLIVIVPLGEFSDFLKMCLSVPLEECIGSLNVPQAGQDLFCDYMIDACERAHVGLSRTALVDQAASGRCVWLLDGLDEVPAGPLREAVTRLIRELTDYWSECQYVITSRPTALRDLEMPHGFDPYVLDRLQEPEIRSFAKRWWELIPGELTRAQRRVKEEDLISQILDSDQLVNLAGNPVMLSLMAVVHFNSGHLPEGRAALLEEATRWLLKARTASEIQPTREGIADIAYQGLAYFMCQNACSNRNEIGKQRASEAITPPFDNSDAALSFLESELRKMGLVVGKGEGNLGFWHSWFLEYLAAKHVSSMTDDPAMGWWAIVEHYLDDPDWQEVVFFVPICLSRLGNERVTLFMERLATSLEDCDLTSRVRRIALAARVLRDLRIAGYSLPEGHKWAEALRNISPSLRQPIEGVHLFERYEASVACGLDCEAWLGDVDSRWVPIPTGLLQMGSQKGCLAEANFDEFSEAWEQPVVQVNLESFDLARFPVTVYEYQEFVEDSGYRREDLWSEAGWKWRTENDICAPGDWSAQHLLPNVPVSAVSWYEARAYCRWLETHDPEHGYDLPSESQWEYAARRLLPEGQRFGWGDRLTEGDEAEANWAGCGLRRKSPVGMFSSSNTADGVCDLIGNVEEWCLDAWATCNVDYPSDGTAREVPECAMRVVRGGSTIRVFRLCRPTYRTHTLEFRRYPTIGFRVARWAKPQ